MFHLRQLQQTTQYTTLVELLRFYEKKSYIKRKRHYYIINLDKNPLSFLSSKQQEHCEFVRKIFGNSPFRNIAP